MDIKYDYTYKNTSRPLPSTATCIPVRKHHLSIIPNIYSGIPQNLLLNLIGFSCLVILFGLLRKKAWNYGRLALLRHQKDDEWMQLFYGSFNKRNMGALYMEASVNIELSQIDVGLLSWIIMAFRVTDEELRRRAGPDGLLYISFERHLIVLVSLMMIVSLCIALPINVTGNMQPHETFGHTTLANLDPMSSFIWVHTFLMLLYLPVGRFIMRSFIKEMRNITSAGELSARTLLVSDVPKHKCNIGNLREHFRLIFPALHVEDITIAYDIKRLSNIDRERDCVEQARIYCENYLKYKGPLKMNPHPCGILLGFCCKSTQVDALEFYTREEIRLKALFEEEKKAVLGKPSGVIFITLDTPEAAKTLRKQLRSSLSVKWTVDWAPTPSDIYWENLSIPKPYWYLNATLINLALAVILFFLTTPAVVVIALNKLPITGEMKNLNPLLSSFLPTLLLVSTSALMPAMVGKSEPLMRHWTRSSLNRAIMSKTLLLLLLMVLILPSLGLTSAQAFFDWTVHSANNTERWGCVFLPDQGAIFVNYVISAALVGCGLELVRFPELALYTFRLCIARSRAERRHVRKAVLWEFPLGAHYAWLLLVFTITTVYSLACPLITPFGLLYLLIKYIIDRHNLCYAYGPSVGGGQLAGAAANAAGAAPILAQAALLALGLVRRGLCPLAVIQLSGLAASTFAFITGSILAVSEHKKCAAKRDLGPGERFVAPVLARQRKDDIADETMFETLNVTDEISVTKDVTMIALPFYQDYSNELNI